MVRVIGIGVAATLVAALAAGCGGSNPKPSPVSSPSASASATPSGAPTMPAEARGTTAASAEAFVRYYFAVYSYAARTGDTSAMRHLTTANCKSCLNSIELIEATYRAGGHATGRGYSVRSLEGKRFERSQATLRGTVIQYSQELISSPSATPTSYPQGTFRARFDLTKGDGTWSLNGLFVL